MPVKNRRSNHRQSGKRDRLILESRRLNAILLLKLGFPSQAAIARHLGVSRQAVSKWYCAKRNSGDEALASKGRPGRKPTLTIKHRKKVQAILKQKGYLNGQWTLKSVAAVIAQVTKKKKPSKSHTRKLLHEMGWSCRHPVKSIPLEFDEKVTRKKRFWVPLKVSSTDESIHGEHVGMFMDGHVDWINEADGENDE